MADSDFIEKARSLGYSRSRNRQPKTTTDEHDHHTVDVTEHWDDRVDVTIKNPQVTVNPALIAKESE